jgi:hypothetical protein
LFLLLFVFRSLLPGLQRLLDVLGRFVGFALRIDGSLCFMGFGRFYPCFVLTGKLKIGLSGIFVERDITLIRLVFFIFQFNVYGLSGFELVVLLIIQFFAPESSWSFLRLALLIALLGILLVRLRLLIVVASVKQELNISFVRIELYVAENSVPFEEIIPSK